jgi:hypothetical protein
MRMKPAEAAAVFAVAARLEEVFHKVIGDRATAQQKHSGHDVAEEG